MEPYYKDDWVTIYHGDCREIIPCLPTVDIVFTDPPYNHGFEYGTHNDKMTKAEYREWINSWFYLLPEKKIIFPGFFDLPFWYAKEPTMTGAWYKPGNPGKGGATFQWLEFEPFLIWKCMFSQSNVAKCPINKQFDTGNHPCPKPLKLFKIILSRLRSNYQIICDPFMGSGTLLKAGKELGIKIIGIEIEERYCEIAAKRLSQEVLNFAG